MRTVFSNDVFQRGGVQAGVQWVKPVGLRMAGTPVPDLRYAQRPQAATLATAVRPSLPETKPAPATSFAARVREPRRMGLFGDIDLEDLPDLIAELPEELAKSFTERLDECFSLLSAGEIAQAASCGQKLYNEIQAARKGETQTEPISTTPPQTQETANGFPWIPVAIGVAGVGILIFILRKKA